MFASGELQPWGEPMAGTAMLDPSGHPMLPGGAGGAVGTTVIASGTTTTTLPVAAGGDQWGATAANNPFGQANGTTAAGYGMTTTDPYTTASWTDPPGTGGGGYGQGQPQQW